MSLERLLNGMVRVLAKIKISFPNMENFTQLLPLGALSWQASAEMLVPQRLAKNPTVRISFIAET